MHNNTLAMRQYSKYLQPRLYNHVSIFTVTYHTPALQGRCCTEPGIAHQRCHYEQSESVCKTLCDDDNMCKGYAGHTSETRCQLATTSPCPGSYTSHVFEGASENLHSSATCGEEGDWNGCYIKGTIHYHVNNIR